MKRVAPDRTVDLRQRGELAAHSYAYYMVRTLEPGQVCELIAAEDPRLIMDGVSLQLRGRIHWDLVEEGPPLWKVRIRPRDDAPAGSLTDLLSRDHERLDRLFAHALACVNRGDVAGAQPYMRGFGAGIRRHLQVENEVLAPAFVAPRDPLGADPTSTMLREHDQILEQVAMIEACLEDAARAGDGEPLNEAVTFMALLSGTLAKHEHREEQNLFPHWDRALALAPRDGRRDALLQRVRDRLGDGSGNDG
ncbi:MAG TPA: hemerythrin domain-containing protein [Gammaproteobacteria bacterium]|nr:hemerythrin domain-containing protein [Gammaproteobacteria bacterium]